MRLILPATLLVAIATGAAAKTGKSVFAHPETYMGKTVTVCGYVQSHFEAANVYVDHAHAERDMMGLTLEGTPIDSWDGSVACLTGRIVVSGCGPVEDRVCLYSDLPYGIEVSGVTAPK